MRHKNINDIYNGICIHASDDININPGDCVLIKTGISIDNKDEYELVVKPDYKISKYIKFKANKINDTYGKSEIVVEINNDARENKLKNCGKYRIHKGDKLCYIVLQAIPRMLLRIYNSSDCQ